MNLKVHKLKIVLGRNKTECGRWNSAYLTRLNTEWAGVTCGWCLAKKLKQDRLDQYRAGIR